MHELSVDVEEDEGDFSVQAAVSSQVDFSPAALALLRDDFVMGDGVADHGTGTLAFSSSNQLKMTLIWGRAGSPVSGWSAGKTMGNRSPSGLMS